MDLEQFIKDFQDHLAPRLDTYEQAIYLYIFRHTRLIGKDEAVIGFKSARRRMACGIGEHGKPMSENTSYIKLASLQKKGCIAIVSSERDGRRIRLLLPREIPDVVQSIVAEPSNDVESIDYFADTENRVCILEREEYKCFYCHRTLNNNNYVIEHVVSRPNGDNSYKNVVAACRECNNRKGSSSAEDWLRTLYREGFLQSVELQNRLSHIERLIAGEIKPPIKGGLTTG